MIRTLGQINGWFEQATTYAASRGFDPNVLLAQRLAPDQFPLVKQVQGTCDVAKLGASRISGKAAPSHPDTEATIAELQARVRSVISYLSEFTAADFADAATRSISTPRWEGKTMVGADYALEHWVPNFFFHATHTYAILRHNGVPLGKRDYLGALSLR